MSEIAITKILTPPARLEGGGFEIRDIMSGISTEEQDPFLIWHELPRKYQKKGEFPGAPMHCHRGFIELPYCKEISGGTSEEYGYFLAKDHTGASCKMCAGDFELGTVACGIEHEGRSHPQWEGWMHFFQLWINLPAANKFDPPNFQNASAAALPVVRLNDKAACKVLVGSVGGQTSPVHSPLVAFQYLDFEVQPGGTAEHQVPEGLTTKFLYVYRGAAAVGAGGREVPAGRLAMLGPGDRLVVAASGEGAGFLFIAGRPIREPVVKHGPFVMNTREQIAECFRDYQMGRLCRQPCTRVQY